MTAPRLSPAQRRVLRAADDGKVSRRRSYPYGWHAADDDGSFAPRAATCDALIDRGLLAFDFDGGEHRWIPAVLTDAGRAALDRNPTTPEGE